MAGKLEVDGNARDFGFFGFCIFQPKLNHRVISNHGHVSCQPLKRHNSILCYSQSTD